GAPGGKGAGRTSGAGRRRAGSRAFSSLTASYLQEGGSAQHPVRDMTLVLGFAALAATLLGGLFALRYQDKLHLILGFSAGAVLAVALFDLLPQPFDHP